MKVIGVSGRRSYLCEVDVRELEVISGSTRGWDDADRGAIGSEFAVYDTWTVLRDLRERRNELPKLAGKLRALADLLEPIQCELPMSDKEKVGQSEKKLGK